MTAGGNQQAIEDAWATSLSRSSEWLHLRRVVPVVGPWWESLRS